MRNLICHICENNKVYKDYAGTSLLDENLNKPCFECFLESEEAKEDQSESDEDECG